MITSFCKDIYQMLCKKYPNRRIFVISDQHFYHKNIINYTRNEFANVLEMNQHILKCHNEVVEKEDIVIFLGDFSFKKGPIKDFLQLMNGHKYLILGNHDSESLVRSYPTLGFEGVFTNPIKIGDDYLSHEPLVDKEKDNLHFQMIVNEFKKQAKGVNYHGHDHTNEFISASYKNVTCEALGYKPMMIGKTINLGETKETPLFINSPYFDEVIADLKTSRNMDPYITICDYIYSYILESLSNYKDKYFVQGSFGLLKKYGFLSRSSDLDISYIFNSSTSKKENMSSFKKMVDEAYVALQQIESMNMSFVKRYSFLRILDMLYTSSHPFFAEGAIDANLVCLDCYKDTDFLTLSSESLVEKHIARVDSSMLDDYKFPHFDSQVLRLEGDIANLLLQIIFQQGYEEKRILALKKLHYIYNKSSKSLDMFLDTFVRFFLRNICLFHTLNRYGEIEYIQNMKFNLSLFLDLLPNDLKGYLLEILTNPNSKFLEVYKEIKSVPVEDTFNLSRELIKKIKR